MNRLLAGIVCLLALAACGKSESDNGVIEMSTEPHYGLATANPLATEAGLRILANGGSAVDAAIAVQAVLGLVEPQSSGFGGGAFMLVYDPALGKVIAYDGRETAPASATPDMFLDDNGQPQKLYDAITGGHSVGIPGVPAMLDMAHKEYGTKPYSELVVPAYDLAVNGFRVSPRLHGLIGRFPRLNMREPAKSYFFDEKGAPLAVGTLLRNESYADTLTSYAEMGAAAFYIGPIADKIIAEVNAVTGEETLTKEDFAVYRAVKREPVCADYAGKRVCSMGPPSSGGVTVLQILELLERTSFASLPPASDQAWHLLMEASRLAYADRNYYLGDPAAMAIGRVGADEIVRAMLNADYMDARAKDIHLDRSIIKVGPGDPLRYIGETEKNLAPDASPEPPSTSHFSIIDKNGLMVSMTSSVEFAFGSHLMAGGMILNNQLTDFSFVPEQDGKPVINAPAPDKRPRSSMSPVIILNQDGSAYAALGSPGGPAIIGYVAKVLVAHLNWDMTLQEAIDLPNIVIPRGGVLVEEDRLDQERIEALKGLGHEVQARALTSGVYGIVVSDEGIIGGVDSRREGSFAAYPAE
ncbi:MAG: gamma-glutamyltransferase [bacterium]